MWPLSPFAKPVSSFERPVPLVLIDPDENPNWQVCFRKEWLPYIVGALKQLLLQTTWNTSDPDALQLVRYRAALLINIFSEGCPVEMPDGGCVTYPMYSPIISWFPLDPYSQPGVIPPGYSGPPFTVLDADDSILHYQKGDVIVSGFPQPDSGITTLPAFGIDVEGAGEVEIHFINALNGGMCAVTVDNNIAGTEYVDLLADITSIPPESVEEVIHEIKLTTSGKHHIDCRFLPTFDDTASNPIRFGGAIRNVTLCDFAKIATELTNGIVLEDLMSQQIRLKPDDPCIIQMWCIDGWQDWYNPNKCVPSTVAQPADGGTVPSGDCKSFSAVLQANGKWLLPVQVNPGDVITVSNVSGAWNDGTVYWSCYNGKQYVLGACASDVSPLLGDPLQTVNHMALIANIGSSYYAVLDGAFVVPPGVTANSNLTFQANDSTLTDNNGSISFDVQICNKQGKVSRVSVDVSSIYAAYMDFSTDAGKVYKVTLSGLWYAGTVNQADAFYYDIQTGSPVRYQPVGGTQCHPTGYLQIEWDNGAGAASPLPSIPAYNASHEYSFYINGNGHAWGFVYCDGPAVYGDNHGVCTVTIEELQG